MKRLFIVFIILFVLMGVFSMDILGRPITDIQKRMVGQTDYRINVVKGIVATVNINRTFGCYIAGETVIYPNIPTFSRDPKLQVGNKVTIEFINGCRETPAILAPEDIRERPDTTLPVTAYEETFNQNYRAVCAHAGTYSVDTTYAEVHNKTISNGVYSNPAGMQVKQDSWFPSGSYHRFDIYRGFLYWDTSSIPAGSTITDVELQIYVSHNYTYRTHNIVVQNGQPAWPANPITGSSYYYARYSGNGGSIASSDITINAWNIITLNDDGKSWINISGETKLCLRVSRDIDNDSPGYAAEGETMREEGFRLIDDPVDGIYAKLVIKYTN